MKKTRWIMGMPITLSVVDSNVRGQHIEDVFSYFSHIDTVFSTYKSGSEISKINRGELSLMDASQEMRDIFFLAEKTKKETSGYFDIYNQSRYDPSGIVKGWAIQNAARLLEAKGYKHYFVDAGGDIQISGLNEKGKPWSVGIRNPFDRNQIVKSLRLTNEAIATSGVSIRGQHIYNPYRPGATIDDIVSMTVIAPSILDADRFATAAFAMGRDGIAFIASIAGFRGYMIDMDGIATYTSGFQSYVAHGVGEHTLIAQEQN